MTPKEFAEGIALIEECLQGVKDEVASDGRVIKVGTSFKQEFLDYLFEEVQTDIPKGLWLKVCKKVARLPCRPRNLTLSDFLRSLESFRAAEVWKKARWKVAPFPDNATSMEDVYRRTLENPISTQAAKDFARGRLEKLTKASTVKACPGEIKAKRVQGGEKYRRMNMHMSISERNAQGGGPQPESEGGTDERDCERNTRDRLA